MLLHEPCEAARTDQQTNATMIVFGVLFCAYLLVDSVIAAYAVQKAQAPPKAASSTSANLASKP